MKLNKKYGNICLSERALVKERYQKEGVKNSDKNGGVIYGCSKAGWCVRAEHHLLRREGTVC